MAFIPNEADAAFPDQAEPDAVDFSILLAAIRGDCVITGCAVTAQGSPDMTVAVAAGMIRINGASVAVSAGNVTVGAAHASNPRFDLITVNDSGTKACTAGTAAANPVFPATPANSVVLAAVYVPANDTDIDANQIVDKRVLVPQSEILVDWSTETLDVDGDEHPFTKQLVLPAGGWDVDLFIQPIIEDDEAEDGFVYFEVVRGNSNVIMFATFGEDQSDYRMRPPIDVASEGYIDVDTSILYARMRRKDSVETINDNVAKLHFNIYCPQTTAFTVSYKAGPIPTPPYTPVLYPGFAFMRAVSVGP